MLMTDMPKNVSEIIEQIVDICVKKADVDELILYGSRAKGTHMQRSDIDIAIKGRHIDIDMLHDALHAVDTLLKIELVDIENCKNELLKKEVEKDGIVLYSKA